MRAPLPNCRAAFVIAAALAVVAAPWGSAAAAGWAPIEPSDLTAKKAVTDPEADAEAVFWEIRVEDALTDAGIHSDVSNYLRLKVFTDRGADAHGKVDVPYEGGTALMDLAARVIRPDGSVVEIKKDAVFQRTILKGNGRKVRAKSFAVPDLKPGSMVEYRWTERRYDQLANSIRVPLQMEFPIRAINLSIKPLYVPTLRYRFQVRAFNVATPHFEDAERGFKRAVFPRMPAFRSEPRMPPENSVRPWLLLGYEWEDAATTEASWTKYAKSYLDANQDRWRADNSVRKKAKEIAGEAGDEGARLARLYEFCRTQIKDVNDDVHGMTEDDLQKVKRSGSPAETLRRGMGASLDIDYLFAALASAAGFQTRVALLPDRSSDFFDSRNVAPMMLSETCVAVQTSAGWRFYDPAARYVMPGSLPWWEEGVEALLLDKDDPEFVPTPMAPPDSSLGKRRGVFTIAADGTLEGDVRAEYTGHWGAARKQDSDENSEAERVKAIEKSVQSHLSGAEVTGIRVEHASDPQGIYAVSYHVRAPGYGTRAGRRLIVDPAFFQRGTDPEFTSSRRVHPVYFSYPWAEDDSVVIRFPEGFDAEALPSSPPFTIRGIAEHSTQLATSSDGRTLVYHRRFEFGREGAIYFPLEEYAKLKQAFDSFEERDRQNIVLSGQGTVP